MSPALLALLVICLLWFGVLIYVFIIRREPDLGAGGKSALLTIAFLLIPIIGFTLWQQLGSKDRLEQIGFVRYSGLGSSVGVLVGTEEQATWLFTLNEPEITVLDFYKRTENHLGWNLISESSDTLVFEKSERQLTLHVGEGKAVFIVSNFNGKRSN